MPIRLYINLKVELDKQVGLLSSINLLYLAPWNNRNLIIGDRI